jgi:Condensation domain/TubC N-terminal docking domain
MTAGRSQGSFDSIAHVLGSIREKGVRLWSENGQLRYQAPKGVLTRDELEQLRASRRELIALLERAGATRNDESGLVRRARRDHAPLAFSQVAHLHLYDFHGQQYENRSVRLVAAAMRVHGPLEVEVLRQSLSEIKRRHEALRTRIASVDGVPTQVITASADCEVEVDDLTTLPERVRAIEAERLMEQFLLEPIDLAGDPLLSVRLTKLSDVEHSLIVAMDHMISDGTSVNIVMRELLAAYSQLASGCELSLPKVVRQFPEHAVRQRNAEAPWLDQHGAYWRERLAGCQRLIFPQDHGACADGDGGWEAVSLRIGKELKARLTRWCRARQTTLVMSAFTAYVALVLRWCGATDGLIQYQANNRVNADIENTVGFFASALYLRLELLANDRFVDLLKRVTAEYCRAYEHADFSYLAAQTPRPVFTRNALFNWTPMGSQATLSDLGSMADGLTCTPIHYVDPVRRRLRLDHDPIIRLCDTGDEVTGYVFFPLNRFSTRTMNRFARNFVSFLTALVERPEERIKDIGLV